MKLRSWGTLSKLPSGRYRASYVGPDLGRHAAPVTFTNKSDGEYWLAGERRLIEQDSWTAPRVRAEVVRSKSKTLGDFAVDWVATRKLKPRTKSGYESTLNNHIKPKLGNVPLSALNTETVRRWYAGLGTDQPTRNAHAYGLLHAICATAVSDGLLSANPCQIKGATNAPTKRQAKILDVAELAALAKAMPDRLGCFVLVSAWCGIRWGEMIELRRKDVSADGSVISVGRGATHRGGCHIDTPKSNKPRKMVVPPHIRKDLLSHLRQHVAKDAEAQLFPAARGGCHLNDKVFAEHFAKACADIKVSGVRVHDLRHFAGTQTARVGNLVETMARLGHSTVKASLIYQQAVSGRDAEIAEALSALALGKPRVSGDTPADDDQPEAERLAG